MPISDKPILVPEPPRPGVPLRRSTFVVMVLLVMLAGLALSLLVPGSRPPAGGSAAADTGPAPVQFGRQQAIDDELASAAQRAVPDAGAAPAPAPLVLPTAPQPTPGATIVPDLRHAASPAFFGDRPSAAVMPPGGVSGNGPADPAAEGAIRLEHEARVRMAKALAHDFSDASEPAAHGGPASPASPGAPGTRGIGIGPGGALLTETPPPARGALAAGRSAPSSVPMPLADPQGSPVAASEAVQPQLDAIRRSAENLATAAPAEARGPSAWRRDYAEASAGQRHAVLRPRDNPHPLVLFQGKVIPAVLTRDLVSDLPGRLTAQVSAPVYDSLGRGELLVPMGSLLVGSYDSGIAEGQSRLMMAFERLILPDGRSFDLPAAPGTDRSGAAGASGSVNHHFLRKFSSALFIAVLADRVRQPAQVTHVGGGGLPTAAGQVLVDVSRGILDQNRVIKPTLTIPAGTRILVEVTSDMAFARHSDSSQLP